MSAAPEDRRRPDVKYLVASGLLGFVLGAFVVASLGGVSVTRARTAANVVDRASASATPLASIAEPPARTPPQGAIGGNGIIPATAPEARDLAARKLTIPVVGIAPETLVRSYHDARSGQREHEAIDILAPRNTPVVAVEDGTVAKLFNSQAGGVTLYQFDPGQQFSYYYAHLERYADGIKEGDHVRRGQVLGYVGTSGNAPKDTPHLHFAIYRLTPDKHWWEGTPIDPYDILR
jgi:peptidoglycan LD-endopeptidase LytH